MFELEARVQAAQNEEKCRNTDWFPRFCWQDRHPIGEYLLLSIPLTALTWWIATPLLLLTSTTHPLRDNVQRFYIDWAGLVTGSFTVGSWLLVWYVFFRIHEEDYSGIPGLKAKWKGRRVFIAAACINLALSIAGAIELFSHFLADWAIAILQ